MATGGRHVLTRANWDIIWKTYPRGDAAVIKKEIGGSVDAVFYDAPNVGFFANMRGMGRVKVVGPLYEGQQYGIAFPKGSDRVEAVNEALAAMREDGTYDEIHAEWFGKAEE